jgi:hypothetical protein
MVEAGGLRGEIFPFAAFFFLFYDRLETKSEITCNEHPIELTSRIIVVK